MPASSTTSPTGRRLGFDLPLLVNMQPAGEYLGEDYQRAGGTAAVMGELLAAGLLDGSPLRVSGRTVAEDYAETRSENHDVDPHGGRAAAREGGFPGHLGQPVRLGADEDQRDLAAVPGALSARPGPEGVFEGRAIVFEGPEDYHDRINDPSLDIDEGCMLFIRGVGPVGYPGGAEVVNMQPPDALIAQGVQHLPTIGDGRQSGTSESPSILNASPESVRGGGLALLADRRHGAPRHPEPAAGGAGPGRRVAGPQRRLEGAGAGQPHALAGDHAPQTSATSRTAPAWSSRRTTAGPRRRWSATTTRATAAG